MSSGVFVPPCACRPVKVLSTLADERRKCAEVFGHGEGGSVAAAVAVSVFEPITASFAQRIAEGFDFGRCERLWGCTLLFASRALHELAKPIKQPAALTSSLSSSSSSSSSSSTSSQPPPPPSATGGPRGGGSGGGSGGGGGGGADAAALAAVLAAVCGPYLEFQRR